MIDPPTPPAVGSARGACPECDLSFSVATLSVPAQGRSTSGPPTEDVTPQRPHRPDAARALRERAFPVYGLEPAWPGRRWLGGSGSSNGTIARIDLGHGEVDGSGAPLLRVETLAPLPKLEIVHRVHAQDLAQRIWQSGGDHALLRPSFVADDPVATWDELVVDVDAVPVQFASLRAGSHLVALARVGEVVVALDGRHMTTDHLRLVTVDDIGPYLSADERGG